MIADKRSAKEKGSKKSNEKIRWEEIKEEQQERRGYDKGRSNKWKELLVISGIAKKDNEEKE